ncbi:MAG TPA: InlB B-repeat-containing protein [Smithella sp.]|nr:InlB B-repeat-containing protein [Smithella sp.]
MRIPAKILAILILLTAIYTVIACDKPNLTAGDITTTPTTTNYTVTFDDAFSNNGSTTTMARPATITVTSPATTISALPTPPTMSGYTFGGWWSYGGGTGIQFTASTTVTSDVIVYAYWYKYPVTFKTDSSTVYATRGTVPPSTFVDYFPTSPTKIGYIFAGWYTAINGGGTQFFGNTEVAPSGITVYANWIPNAETVYAVNYDGNGGTSIGAQYVISPATTVGALPTPPTQLFYVFAGWNTHSDGSGTSFTASTPVTADITVYAQWSSNPGFTVTYNSGWGTSVDAQYVIPPATTVGTLPTAPTKPCYTFGGWYTAENGGGTLFTAVSPVTADITVYAQWTWVGSTTTPTTYAIGDPGPSCVGKVFYIEGGGSSGTHGLEAAPPGWYDWYSSDADPSLAWISGDPVTDSSGNVTQQTQITLNGNTSTAIGTGKANSDAIITQSGTTASSYSAAAVCEAYVGGGFKDWFLPSLDELAQLYANQDVTRWGGFQNRYWSSSEYNTWYSWSQYFYDSTYPGIQASTLKSAALPFRPVRAF